MPNHFKLCTQLNAWIFEKRPNCFWLTGFFNPQGFLTAMRQETTRAHAAKGWALDAVKLTNDITKMLLEDVTSPPNPDIGGVYIHGFFLDGAGWDKKNMKLIEPSPKVFDKSEMQFSCLAQISIFMTILYHH